MSPEEAEKVWVILEVDTCCKKKGDKAQVARKTAERWVNRGLARIIERQ